MFRFAVRVSFCYDLSILASMGIYLNQASLVKPPHSPSPISSRLPSVWRIPAAACSDRLGKSSVRCSETIYTFCRLALRSIGIAGQRPTNLSLKNVRCVRSCKFVYLSATWQLTSVQGTPLFPSHVIPFRSLTKPCLALQP